MTVNHAPDIWHIGRSWVGSRLEDECPCEQEPCGLVSQRNAHPDCAEHPVQRGKSIRQSHRAGDCPGMSA